MEKFKAFVKGVKRNLDARAKSADHFDKAGDPKNPNASKDLRRAVKYHNVVNREETELGEAYGKYRSPAWHADGGANDERHDLDRHYSKPADHPHAVHINGTKWKSFGSQSHAQNVANKIKGATVHKEEANLDKFKKYVRPVVKTTPKIERSTNPAGRTTDHVEWKVTTPTGEIHRHKTKKEAQAHFDSFGKQGVAEGSEEGMTKHKVAVTVSDPNHTAVSQRKDKVLKNVVVSASDEAGAKEKATKFYKQKGYTVHGCEYHSKMNEAGLWDNIHAKRKRIANGSGEKMRKPGSKGAPSDADFKAANEALKPGWMLKADPKLGAAVKAKQDLAKKRQASYGNPAAGKSAMKEELKADIKSFRAMIEEASYKVDVEGLPTMYVQSDSPTEVKSNLRKILKKADMIKSVDRIPDAEVKKAFRLKAMGKDEE